MHFASSKSSGKRSLNFELNLIPFIDVLSTCICFLLVTAVFINLGSFNVNQAIGDAAAKEKEKKGSVTVSMGSGGDVRFEVKDVPGTSSKPQITTVRGVGGKIDFDQINRWIASFANQSREVKTVLILPNPTSRYDDIIQIMSSMRKYRLDQIGIAPL